MERSYFYRIYGLIVRSEICIREAYPCVESKKADVEIVLGKVPEFLREAGKQGYGTWTNGFINAWFRTLGAAQFYVERGNKILVEPEKNGNQELVCTMVLSAGFSLILLQRNEIMLHGSAISVNGKAIIVSGDSGVGKSTITMALLEQNNGFLADDTVHIHVDGEEIIAEPSYPQQKICRNLAEEYNLDLSGLRYIDEQRDKFALMRRDRYLEEGMPLETIFILKKTTKDTTVFSKELRGKDYLEAVFGNLYLAGTYRKITGVPVEMMQHIISMEKRVNICEIYRPEQGDSVKDVLIEINKILHFC